MNLFRKNKKQDARLNEPRTEEDVLQELALFHLKKMDPGKLIVNVNGVSITPIHNQNVLKNVAAEIIRVGNPVGSKENNIHQTNFYVFFALKEGAEKQGVPFPDSAIKVFHYIDLVDYHRIILAASKALGILKAAIISTGIGALVIALGSLISYFTKTQRGADFVSKVMKGLQATINVLVDRFSALGEMIFKACNDPKKAVAGLWDAIKTNIVNRFEGIIDLFRAVGLGLESLWKRDLTGLKTAANDAGQAMMQLATGFDAEQQKRFADSIRGVTNEIREESKAAAELEKRRQALRDREISLIEVQAIRRKELEAARLLAEDETIAAEERYAALKKAQDYENQTLEENKSLQREKIAIMEQEIALGESTAEEYRKLAEEKARLQEIEGQSFKLQRRLATEMNSLTKEITAQSEAIKKLRAEQTEMFKPLESKSFEFPAITMPEIEMDKLLSRMESDLESAQSVIMDFAGVFQESFASVSEDFVSNLGAMIAGTDSTGKDFSDIVLKTFGDMAVHAGKIIMQAGIAFFAIGKALKAALNSPLAAVAAGAALMAVGKAAQASLSKVGSSSGSGSGGVGQNSYVFDTREATEKIAGLNSAANNPEQKPISVRISGEFRQRGSDMVAVLNQTNKQSSYKGR